LNDREAFDFIIIGGGSAGGMLLDRLSQNPDQRVLLLEAGGSDRHWSTRIPAGSRFTYSGGARNWCFETEPEPFMNNRRLFQPRGKVLGGSSSLNGMVYVRGNARDFDAWAEGGATGWSYADVLPAFKSIETYHPGADDFRGGDGPIQVTRHEGLHAIEEAFLSAAQQAGYERPADYNGASQDGFAPFDANFHAGYRSGTGAACIEPAMARPNVTVRTNAFATRVVFEGTRAVGVDYVRGDKAYTVRADREVVLAAGAFQSPQLLMLSGVGPADHLKSHGIHVVQDLPGVGQNLQDHLEIHVKHRCGRGLSNNHLMSWPRMALAGVQWALFKTGPAAISHSRVGGFVPLDSDSNRLNGQFHFWPYYLEGWSPPPDKDGYTFDVGPVLSESRGTVTLRSADPAAAPRIQLNGLSTDKDLAEFRAAIRMARDIAAQSAFDFCRGPETFPGPDVASNDDLNAVIRAHANSAYHPCGTCKMGTDEQSVTNPTLRVHGIEHLRIADASVMPTVTAGNINAPCFMIGARAADFINIPM